MDLAIIIPLLEKYGGAERYVVECLRHWQHNHDITIYAAAINEELLAEHGIGKQVKRSLLTPYFDGPHSMLLNALLLPKIWLEEIGRHDIYHPHLWPTHLIDLHPMVWYPHEPLRVLHDLRFEQSVEHIGREAARNVHIYPKYNYDRIGDSLYEAYLSSIDAMDKAAKPERIVANSGYTAKYLEDVYGSPVTDIVYPGVDPDAFIDLPTDPNLFVTISQLWSHKRVNLLIESIAMTDEAQLIVIGSGPEKARLLEVAAKLGVDDRVFFLSGLSNWELKLVLARACAFLFSPVNEPFGIVVLEAMAAGKPVIAVNQGGYVEACHPDYAFLVPPFPSAFAEKISFLQNNPDVARRMGQAGQRVAPNYTWKKAADELEAVLVDTWQTSRAKRPQELVVSEGETLVGAQYYVWYGDGFGAAHWNDNTRSGYVSDKPLFGYYSSTKGQTIQYHMDLFEQIGLDYVVINLHVDANGANGIELMGLQHVFDIARKRKSRLRFAVQLAPYTDDSEDLVKTIQLIEKLYASHPNYFSLGGKPVLFWFWSSALDGNRRFISELAAVSGGFANLALSLRLPKDAEESKLTFNFFQGFAPFSPLELSGEKNWQKVWTAAYRSAEKAGMTYRIATISPGYDDHSLDDEVREGNQYRVVDRENGETYGKGMKFVEELAKPPHLVMISTFNEFHENSHIEPSIKNGMRYVEMTQSFVARIKDKVSDGKR
ncbi:glycosyltransferase [Paraburkholderia sp. BR10923]|uniref:glycosyltransferase n=1 Tax=Paraburkholderia sp. BR10923 TaxID=3236992 RepID=UPI0034CF67E5